ncbi:MAG: S1C family serine protease, partial [Acetobacteraceae bacterium]
MPNADWEIPAKLQPDPDDYPYDLQRTLRAVVGLKSYIAADAFTADTLGTERAGSGVVIRESGLIATIGYLITEAETIWITSSDGGAVPGHALAYDQETGFGLVQALGRLNLPALELGDSDSLKVGDQVVFAASGGRHHSVETRVVGRQEFAGYWEYVLDDAIFTAPAHPFWGGGALIGTDGRLLGLGSLILQRGNERGHRLDMNMVVPIDLLAAVID